MLYVLEFLYVLVKFLISLGVENYNIVTAEERDVSNEIVLITGTGIFKLFTIFFFASLNQFILQAMVLAKDLPANILHLAPLSSAGISMKN